jgi:hypothetical protein
MLQSAVTYPTATETLLEHSARHQALQLSLAERCVAIIYTGIRKGLPTVWVRKEEDGPPTNADTYTRSLAFDNGAVRQE